MSAVVDLTTLQLARKVADAVLAAVKCANYPHFYRKWLDDEHAGYDSLIDLAAPLADALQRREDHEDPATQAVLRTLREHSSWFCRLREEPQGGATKTVQEPYPVEAELHDAAKKHAALDEVTDAASSKG